MKSAKSIVKRVLGLVCLLVPMCAMAQAQVPFPQTTGVPTIIDSHQTSFQQQTHFLTFLGSYVPESPTTAAAYYKAIDPNGTKGSFPQWLKNAGFISDVSEWNPTGKQKFACALGTANGCDYPAGTHGFLRQPDGTIASFDAPGPGFAQALNSKGQIAGYYFDAATHGHGYLRQPDGNITPFDPPGSNYTEVYAINSGGQITGFFFDSANVVHGFVRHKDGTFTSFDPTGSSGTFAFAINSEGQITGYYVDAAAVTHGFLRHSCEVEDGSCE